MQNVISQIFPYLISYPMQDNSSLGICEWNLSHQPLCLHTSLRLETFLISNHKIVMCTQQGTFHPPVCTVPVVKGLGCLWWSFNCPGTAGDGGMLGRQNTMHSWKPERTGSWYSPLSRDLQFVWGIVTGSAPENGIPCMSCAIHRVFGVLHPTYFVIVFAQHLFMLT